MLVFGHLGIGKKLAQPWARGLPVPWLFLGTLLPDLVDKPLYYGLSWSAGAHGAALGLVSGTRTFGHTALFLGVLMAIGIAGGSRRIKALALGVATHLLLDQLTPSYAPESVGPVVTGMQGLLWPFLGGGFPAYRFKGAADHFWTALKPFTLAEEGIGVLFLAWDYWKFRQADALFHARRLFRARPPQ